MFTQPRILGLLGHHSIFGRTRVTLRATLQPTAHGHPGRFSAYPSDQAGHPPLYNSPSTNHHTIPLPHRDTHDTKTRLPLCTCWQSYAFTVQYTIPLFRPSQYLHRAPFSHHYNLTIMKPRLCLNCDFRSKGSNRCSIGYLNPSTKERYLEMALNLPYGKICKYNKFKLTAKESAWQPFNLIGKIIAGTRQ